MKEKLKSWLMNDQLFYGFLLFLVSVSSFVLGRISVENPVVESSRLQIIEPITLSLNNKQEASTMITKLEKNQKTANISSQIVASKNGTKYYLSTCSGVKRIKTENLIYFSTSNEAEAAGYSKAANCPGL